MPLTNTAFLTSWQADISDTRIYSAAITLSSSLVKLDLLTKTDDDFKILFDDVNVEIDKYNTELIMLDCSTRFILTESMVDAASRDVQNSTQNPLYHNGNTYLPSYRSPYLLSNAIGAINGTTTNCYTDRKGSVETTITTFNGSGTVAQRATGQICSGASPDYVVSFNTVVNAMNSLKTAVNNCKSFLQAYRDIIYKNSGETLRDSQGLQAFNNANITITGLDEWIAKDDFAPVASTTSCATFNAITFSDTKGSTTSLTNLQNLLNDQQTYNTTRISQIKAILGDETSLSQNTSTGLITLLNSSLSEILYLKRYLIVNARVSRTTGTLREKYSTIINISQQQIKLNSLYLSLSASKYI